VLCPVPCVQGYGPQAVTMLLEAGADPFHANMQGQSAIAMTANQVGHSSTLAMLCYAQGHCICATYVMLS
jgi:hypothetical protein